MADINWQTNRKMIPTLLLFNQMMTFLYTELKNRMAKEKSEFYIEMYYFPSVYLQLLMINQNQFQEKGNQSQKLEKFPTIDQLITADLV